MLINYFHHPISPTFKFRRFFIVSSSCFEFPFSFLNFVCFHFKNVFFFSVFFAYSCSIKFVMYIFEFCLFQFPFVKFHFRGVAFSGFPATAPNDRVIFPQLFSPKKANSYVSVGNISPLPSSGVRQHEPNAQSRLHVSVTVSRRGVPPLGPRFCEDRLMPRVLQVWC